MADHVTVIRNVGIKNATDARINPATEESVARDADGLHRVRHGPTQKITGLSFVETFTTPHVTTWVDVSLYPFLDFNAEIGAAEAVTALIEFTDATDPNTTPPGANDIVIPRSSEIGGVSLGGPSNTPTFTIKRHMKWARVTLTSLTGSQSVKVSCFGLMLPPVGSSLPFAATVTGDFNGPLSRAGMMGQDFDDPTQFVNMKVRKSRADTADSCADMEVLTDYSYPIDEVHEFVFSRAVDTIQIHAFGAEARATNMSQTPSVSLGVRCPDDQPIWLPAQMLSGGVTKVRVWAPATTVVTVWAFYY